MNFLTIDAGEVDAQFRLQLASSLGPGAEQGVVSDMSAKRMQFATRQSFRQPHGAGFDRRFTVGFSRQHGHGNRDLGEAVRREGAHRRRGSKGDNDPYPRVGAGSGLALPRCSKDRAITQQRFNMTTEARKFARHPAGV
ncbi:hypothetical protein A6B37_05115 [Achromobacter sp. HZ01]|nr:hypothetical protein A6B37_05115 [Achromobacter sp. HZ01]